MKRKPRFWVSPLFVGLVVVVLALAGCGGSDGDDGAPGATGPAGPPGQDAVAAGDVVPLNPVLDLSNTISYDAASGVVTIHFFLTESEDGPGIDVTSDAYEMRVYVSELVPNTDPAEGLGGVWHQMIAERGTPAAGSPMDGTLTLVDAATGEYTYACATPLPASPNVIRATVRARWREDVNGERVVFANPVNASYDFLQADPGTELASSGADTVTTEACETCHGARIGDVGHGGGYTEVKTCDHCHNLDYQATRGGPEADLAFMIHRIHDAGVFTELGDFSEVTYPQEIHTCTKCHVGPEANLAFTVLTRNNCGSCHDNVDFATGAGHAGGPMPDDADCDVCHNGGIAQETQVAHEIAPAPANVPEFDVTLSMSPPANGEFYVAGEAPAVVVTLASGGVPVPGTLYTADQDAAGNAGAGLSAANLFVYGPRSNAVPVLTTNSTTDPAYDPTAGAPTQGHPLFLNRLVSGVPTPNDDPLIRTDPNWFAYQLLPIPANLAPGTYMVRFEGGDYGAVDETNYQTSSTAVINFQVGTAEEEHKRSGDACTDCHGDTIMHLEGAHPHHAPFDTDGCLACHDLSDNYGEYIGNRVHAVHGATVTGDLHATQGDVNNRDWSEVTFPRPANNCRTCHTDPDAETPVWRDPNEIACGGCHGADPTATPARYPTADPAQVNKEAVAAAHMEQQGGTFDPNTTNPNDPAYVQRQCIVCHGEGRIADLFVTHDLVNFPAAEPEDPNE